MKMRFDHLNDVAMEAVGHFFFGWGEEDAPHILAPYKYRLCNKQHGDAYSEFSSLLLDQETQVLQFLDGVTDKEFIDNLNRDCIEIFDSIDDN